ncbi:hypothetical protein NDU88_004188 [Pleurodeles waltl]|uniref:Uncharacterized protein n=1 Tax=Pleurodeles waltl TaxID=8319 RepID=A0AAV7LKJ6_PLEWA|nr:hypothetical protein NDU88_004188 [Pleurodeles waltl]
MKHLTGPKVMGAEGRSRRNQAALQQVQLVRRQALERPPTLVPGSDSEDTVSRDSEELQMPTRFQLRSDHWILRHDSVVSLRYWGETRVQGRVRFKYRPLPRWPARFDEVW